MGTLCTCFGGFIHEPAIPKQDFDNINMWLKTRHYQREPEEPVTVNVGPIFGHDADDHRFDTITDDLPWATPRHYNDVQPGLFSLHSSLELTQGMECTVLAWDNNEKALHLDEWFTWLITMLRNVGYTVSGGVEYHDEDDDHWWLAIDKSGTLVYQCKKPDWFHNPLEG